MSSRLGFSVRKSKSRSRRAGLLFPVGRIHRLCRKGPWVGSRIAAGAPVYLAAVMEYLAAELLEQAGLASRFGRNDGRITPRHLKMAVKRDQELNILCAGVTMAGGNEVVEKDWMKLGKADMAGDLRAPTYQSMVRREERKLKKKQKKGDKTIQKRKGQYMADLAVKDKGPIVDLTEPSCEPVIDLTQDSKKESRGSYGPTVVDSTGTGLKRINSEEILRSDLKHYERLKKGGDDTTNQQRPSSNRGRLGMVEKAVDKSGKDSEKVHSFEEEMFRVDRRYELLKKGRDEASKQQRPSTSLGMSNLVEQTAGKTGKDPKRVDSRRVHSFREEMIRIDHSRFKLKKGGDAPSRPHTAVGRGTSGMTNQEKNVEELEDNQRFHSFKREIKRINNKFDKKPKDARKQHGLTSDNVEDFLKMLDGVRKGEKRSPGI